MGLRVNLAPVRSTGGSPPSTASRNAARTPCDSSTASPAAVVPPGDVTAARNDSGDSSPSASSVAAPSSVWRTSCSVDVARQPDEHAGFDHRLGHEEHVGRTRARQSGHGVELRLGDPHDDPDRAEDAFADLEVELGRAGTGGDGGGAPADERAGVGHGPHDRTARRGGFERRRG